MVYPTIADLYARSNLSNASLADYYNIQQSKVGTGVSRNITTTISKCLHDYCTQTLAGSGCTDYLYGLDNTSTPLNISSTFYIWSDTYYEYAGDDVFDLCLYIPKSLNPDIGGIGV